MESLDAGRSPSELPWGLSWPTGRLEPFTVRKIMDFLSSVCDVCRIIFCDSAPDDI